MSRSQIPESREDLDYAVDFVGRGGLDERAPAGESIFMSEDTTLSTSTGGPLGEISQAPPAFEAFLDKHQMKIIILAVILALLAAGYVIFNGLKEGAEHDAGAALSSANDISELQSVVKNHGDTPAAYSAKVLLAEKQWDDGQQDDAIATLREFVENDRNHPARPSAEASLAAKLWSQGKNDEAQEFFKDLTDDVDSRYLAPYAWIALGDIEMGKGNVEAAGKAYETVERDFPGSTFSQDAMNRRLLAKAKAPVEVAAPISVPEVKLGGDKEGTSASDAPVEDIKVKDLIDAVKGGAGTNGGNPLMPEENPTPPSE